MGSAPLASLSRGLGMALQSGEYWVGRSICSVATCVFDLVVSLTWEAPKSPYKQALVLPEAGSCWHQFGQFLFCAQGQQ